MEISNNLPKKSVLLTGILLLLILIFLITVFGGRLTSFILGESKIEAGVMYGTRILFWSSLLFIFLFSRKIEKQDLLIWDERKLVFWQILVSCMAIFFALIIGLGIIGVVLMKIGFVKESAKFNEILTIFRLHPFLIFFTAGTAGFVEELTFRGYLLPRMTIIFKSPLIAILLTSVLFGLMHFGYGTVFQVVGPFFIGLIFAIYYYYFRNIKVIILCHILWDLIAIYLQLLFKK
ncbi:hypothetical protein BH09BAC5_BH09BAC5_29240 [soil metagenome]